MPGAGSGMMHSNKHLASPQGSSVRSAQGMHPAKTTSALHPSTSQRFPMKAFFIALLLIAGNAFAESRVYLGGYASGSAAWTVKNCRIYAGSYASGSASWTWKDSHIYKGDYASGSPAWTWKDGHLYAGGYASGTPVWTWKDGRVYRGGYASGSASFAWRDRNAWLGNYTSGTPFLTLSDLDEIPEPIFVFLIILAS